MRARKSFSDVASAEATVSRKNIPRETLILKRCVVQLPAVTSTRNQVSYDRLAKMNHYMLSDGHPAPAMHSSALLTTEA
jgi:hypothetical protein